MYEYRCGVAGTDQAIREAGVKNSVRTYGVMGDIVDINPGVLDRVTPYVFSTAESWASDALAFGREVTNIAKGGKIAELPEDGLSRLEQFRDRLTQGGLSSVGHQAALFDVQAGIFAYHVAAAHGQDGKNLAEGERKFFQGISEGKVSPEKFHQAMADVLLTTARNVDAQGRDLFEKNITIDRFENDWQYKPAHYKHQPIEDELNTTADSGLRVGWSRLKPYDRDKPTPLDPEITTPTPGSVAPIQIPPEMTDEQFNALPKGTKYITPDGKPGTKKY